METVEKISTFARIIMSVISFLKISMVNEQAGSRNKRVMTAPPEAAIVSSCLQQTIASFFRSSSDLLQTFFCLLRAQTSSHHFFVRAQTSIHHFFVRARTSILSLPSTYVSNAHNQLAPKNLIKSDYSTRMPFICTSQWENIGGKREMVVLPRSISYSYS